MRKNIDAVMEGLNESRAESMINESKNTSCPSNIDSKKYTELVKKCNKVGYKVSEFSIGRLNSKLVKWIAIDLMDYNSERPNISYVEGKFYVRPRTLRDYDYNELKTLIKLLTEANDLCNWLNKENFESYMTADLP